MFYETESIWKGRWMIAAIYVWKNILIEKETEVIETTK